MIATSLALALAIQAATPAAPPRLTPEQEQARGQAAIEGMAQVYTVLGSCERHFTPEQVRAVRAPLEPEPGAAQSPLQSLIDQAYQRGKADTTKSAPFCQEVMRMLAEAQRGG
ncbi:hypothetical protein [Brevundimonas sp. Root1279]|uniref:hypothetical protein n=1 Tax=Brevundimonas sp. Root1279 TaxID=1736443 RepID=UPI0006F227C5|nr:hypothetical protein [Brevundimonas sp. Root1279]KQW82263.1 hypothetical protein ASC65_08290 [Brevundimonas sp. Root1279]